MNGRMKKENHLSQVNDIKLESQIQREVIKALESAGWYVIKLIQTNKNGIPDLVCHRESQTIYIEVKRPKKHITHLQELRYNRLIGEGIPVYVIINSLDLKKHGLI